MSVQCFESELFSEHWYNEVCKEKVPERKAGIMATGLGEKMRADNNNFQKMCCRN